MVADFDEQKKFCLDKLYKPDKSRKGEVDKAIIPLIEHINSLNDYYTTSSCSGRIYLLTEAYKKRDVKWLYTTHEEAEIVPIMDALVSLPDERVWLRQENLILHVACRTMGHAGRILKIARSDGFQRSGIIADAHVIFVEICSTEKMDVPIAEKGKLLVSDDYIKLLVDIANQKFFRGRKKLQKLERDVREKVSNI